MMTSISRFLITSIEPEFATRAGGREAFFAIQRLLVNKEAIELDFSNRALTPSFADECIGGLVLSLGISEFKRRVKLVNIQEASRPLVRHLVLKAASKYAQRDSAIAA